MDIRDRPCSGLVEAVAATVEISWGNGINDIRIARE
jgi:hypothetical protein